MFYKAITLARHPLTIINLKKKGQKFGLSQYRVSPRYAQHKSQTAATGRSGSRLSPAAL